jgi:group I intron endonuclease
MKVEDKSKSQINKTGVYLIKNIVSGSFYIGSTSVSFGVRLSQHLAGLNRGMHENFLLQKSWDKHGEKSFVFEVAEVVDEGPEVVIGIEQSWLDATNGNRKRLNLSPSAGSSTGVVWSEEKKARHSEARARQKGIQFLAISPEGVVYNVCGLRPFARQNSLDRSSIKKVLDGKWHSYKQWLFIPSGMDKPVKPPPNEEIKWVVISPGGERFDVANLEAFSREHGLTSSGLQDVARGRIKQHKQGWKCFRADGSSPPYVDKMAKRRKKYVATSPDGTTYVVVHLPQFCSKHGLMDTRMRDCARGAAASHRGWQCRYEGDKPRPIDRTAKLRKSYVVTTPKGVEINTDNLPELCKEYKLGLPGQIGLGKVARGQASTYKGWLCRFADGTSPNYQDGNAKKRKSYVVTSPQQEIFHVDHLSDFCKTHGLGRNGQIGLGKVARGQAPSYKGWLCRFA